MNKYIVKNCPAYVSCYDNCTAPKTISTLCKDCTDCLIKQVIEKCNKAVKIADLEGLNGVYRRGLANEILQLFKIEECTDEVS